MIRIVQSQVSIVSLPLHTPFHTALRQTNEVTDIRVTLTLEDGTVGVGSTAPTPAITGETTESIVTALQQFIFPALQSVELADRENVFQVLGRSIVHNTSAKAAVDIALHDLYAKQARLNLYDYLASHRRGAITGFSDNDDSMNLQSDALSHLPTLSTDATVSLNSVEKMVTQGQNLVAVGFSTLKIKLGGRDGKDIERVAAIRQALGDDIVLRVDANQAWEVAESIAYVNQLAPYRVELVEQPIPAWNMKGLRQVTKNSPIPIVADESIFQFSDLQRLLDMRGADIINIKLMKTGGIHQAMQMIELIQDTNLQWMMGSMMEGPASMTAAAQLASAYGCSIVDLDAGYFLKHTHALGGIRYAGEAIHLPLAPGLGLEFAELR